MSSDATALDNAPSMIKLGQTGIENGDPRLYYYDCFGKAEAIRMLFYHAKINYEDIRVDLNDARY